MHKPKRERRNPRIVRPIPPCNLFLSHMVLTTALFSRELLLNQRALQFLLNQKMWGSLSEPSKVSTVVSKMVDARMEYTTGIMV